MVMKESAAVETVKNTVTAASIFSHLKNNRLEYLGLVILCHLVGVSDRVLAQMNGVCF